MFPLNQHSVIHFVLAVLYNHPRVARVNIISLLYRANWVWHANNQWVIFPLAPGLWVHVRSDAEARLETIQTNNFWPQGHNSVSVQCGKRNGRLGKRAIQKKNDFWQHTILTLNGEKYAAEMCHCCTRVLSVGRPYRDETKTASFSFIGLPGALLVCFGELAVLVHAVSPWPHAHLLLPTSTWLLASQSLRNCASFFRTSDACIH